MLVYGVDLKDFEVGVLWFLDDYGDFFCVIVIDLCGCIVIDWGVIVLFEIFIVNGKGEVVYCFVGLLIVGNLDNIFMFEFEKVCVVE